MEIKETWTDENGREFNLVALLKTKHTICIYEYAEKQGTDIFYCLATIKDGEKPFFEEYHSNFGGSHTIDDLLNFKNTMEYIRKMSIDVHLGSNN